MRCGIVAIALLLVRAAPAAALGPEDVIVISNRNLPDSQRVAEHYIGVRSIPERNHLPLDLPGGETISRADFQNKLVRPLRRALSLRRNEVKVLLTVYGVPLRVGPKIKTAAEKRETDKIEDQLRALDADQDAETAAKLRNRKQILLSAESEAAVDSELMLLWWPEYPLTRWIVNPLYFALPDDYRQRMPDTVMTARIDGPSPDVAIRMINDAVATEEEGLKGKAYIDARGIAFDPQKTEDDSGTGYAGYDESFRETAELLKLAKLDVTLNNQNELFEPHTCPDCALYAGWYSRGNYIPSCDFVQGAIAWHLASSEAVTLRDRKTKLWCPNLLNDGAAVTLGPVAEPYTLGFPKPAEFFGFLATGKYTVVECYAKTTLVTSWMIVLIGDPLYNPFAKTPLLEEQQIHASPKGAALKFKQTPEK